MMRWIAGAGMAMAGSVFAVGLLHLPAARPLLAAVAGCPMPTEVTDAAALEAARRSSLAAMLGDDPVGEARMSVGLVLGVADRADVRRVATRWEASCVSVAAGTGLRCVATDTEASPILSATFDPDGRLVAGTLTHASRDVEPARAHWDIARSRLVGAYGPAGREVGDPAPSWLAGGPLRQARSEWRGQEVFARLALTSAGDGRYVVSETHQLRAEEFVSQARPALPDPEGRTTRPAPPLRR